MFFGSLPQFYIHIVDATASSFKEFIQYFYLDTIKLTIENATEVIYLAKKYEVHELMNICSSFLQRNLSLDQMCIGLQLAMTFDITELKAFCTDQIVRNRTEFFRSMDFLSCSIDVLKMILKLDDLKFYGQDRFGLCLRWARHTLLQRNDNERPKLEDARILLNDCFNLIEFGSMEGEAIISILAKFNKFFTANDLGMMHKILAAKFPVDLNHIPETPCNLRILGKTQKNLYIKEVEVLTFQSSRKMFLVGLRRQTVYDHTGIHDKLPILLTVIQKSPNANNDEDIVLLRQNHASHITKHKKFRVMYTSGAIAIEPYTEYELQLKFLDYERKKYFVTSYFGSNVCDLRKNGKVSIDGHSIISSLRFKIPS